MLERYPELNGCAPDLVRAFETLMRCFARAGRCLLRERRQHGDAMHIAGELDKSFRSPRVSIDENSGAGSKSSPVGRTWPNTSSRGCAASHSGSTRRWPALSPTTTR